MMDSIEAAQDDRALLTQELEGQRAELEAVKDALAGVGEGRGPNEGEGSVECRVDRLRVEIKREHD